MDELIQSNIEGCKLFEVRLKSLIIKYKEIEEEASGNNEILRKWLNLCNENYAIQRRMVSDYLTGDSISEDLEENMYRRQIGARLYPLFINFINSFEYLCEVLYLNSEVLKSHLTRNNERSFAREFREVFKNINVITENQSELLKFIWQIRNAMHRNNFPRQKIEFTLCDYDTGQEVSYSVQVGESIYTPEWGLDKITEAMSTIMIKVIGEINDLNQTNITDII